MMFIDSPSQFAPVEKWQAYLQRLSRLNQGDSTVVSETSRAKRIIALLQEEDAKDREVDRGVPPA